jgi:hypothetical protein
MKAVIRVPIMAILIFRGIIASADEGQRSDALNASFDATNRWGTEWRTLRNDTLRSDFPTFQIRVFDNPAPGKVFMCPFLRGTPRYTT